MISAIGRTLLQVPRLAPSRQLSGVVTSTGLLEDVPDSPGIAGNILNWKNRPPKVNLESIKAVHGNESVYIAMSSLLIPKQNLPPPSEKIALLNPTVFNHPIRRDILHLCVVHYLDSLRQGSASTKTRADVRGSGIKILRQKGSGKARVGDGQSPIRRGGGVVFGPKPRDFSTKLPRKVLEMGMRVALSAKVKDQRLGVVESLAWPGLKTKHLCQRIDHLGWRKTLFVTGEEQVPIGLERSSRNIQMVDVTRACKVNTYSLLKWQRVVMDIAAIDWFEQTLGKNRPP